MNAKLKRNERSRRFRRLRNKKAVSPVVATLILILIAVAAAAALYLWLVAWQGGVTKGIGSPSAQYTVTIGGSTSVYPFAVQAASWFEQNNSNIVISVNQGGSGAGAAAVCSGQIDIGQYSAFVTPATLTSDGCNLATVATEIVAYDGVDPIVASNNNHGLNNMTWDTLQAIYADASATASSSGSNIYVQGSFHENGILAPVQPAQGAGYTWNQIPACAAADLNVCGSAAFGESPYTTLTGVAIAPAAPATYTGTTNVFTGTVGTPITQTITGSVTYTVGALSPSYVAAVTLGALTANLASSATNTLLVTTGISITSQSVASGTATIGWSIGVKDSMNIASPDTVAFNAGFPTVTSYSTPVIATASTGTTCGSDICVAAISAATSESTPCGFTVCAGGPNNAIQVNYRSDVSGTTQSFISRDLAVGASGPVSPLSVGFTGCGGDNQFDGCGWGFTAKTTTGGNGNPGVISNVAGSKDALGYASDGLAQSSTSGVTPVNFQGYGQSVVVTIVGESKALGAIAKGIADHEAGSANYATDQAYIGWRPFENIQTAPPTGEVLRYLQYVMDPANNEAIAAATAEISVYASGLAGTVPVTPIP